MLLSDEYESWGIMACNQELAERIRNALVGRGAVEKHMFGGLCFMVKGAMCCGVYKDDLIARVGSDLYDEAMAQPHARPMDITGRPMRGFLFVAPEGVGTDAELRRWLDWCTSYAGSDEVQKRSKRGRRKSPKRKVSRG